MDYKKLADEKYDDWESNLFKRMDDDRRLLQLEKYQMRDLDGKVVTGVLHTTLNDPAMFGAWVIAELLAMKEIWQVNGDKLPDSTTSTIERFIKDRFADANLILRNQGKPETDAFMFDQLCYRGRASARCLTNEDGSLDIMPCDTRYLTYDTDNDGLKWWAPRYRRTKSMIEAKYPQCDLTKFPEGELIDVVDLWIREDKTVWNEIYFNDELVRPQEYTLGKRIPAVLQVVPLGSFFGDADNLKREGESIFWLARDIIPMINEITSIMRSIAFRSYAGSYTWDNDGELPEGSPNEPGRTDGIDAGTKGWSLVQMQDLQNSAIHLLNVLDTRLQAATRSRIEEGTLTFTLSAVGIKELKKERDKLYIPRLTAGAYYKLGLQEMFTQQFIDLGMDIESNSGNKYSKSDIDKNYKVALEYSTVTPTDDIANWSLFTAIGGSLSQETKLRDIIKVDDVTKEMRLLNRETAKRSDPAIAFYDLAHELIDIGDTSPLEEADRYYNQAVMMAQRGARMWKEMLATGQIPPSGEAAPMKQAGNILPPLMQGGQSGQKA